MERKVGTRFWSSQARDRISRHRADRSEYDYRSTTKVDKTITSQIAAHNQSDQSTTKIQDPKLTSDRLRAGFPSGRTVGQSSAGYAPPTKLCYPAFPPNSNVRPFLFVNRELGASNERLTFGMFAVSVEKRADIDIAHLTASVEYSLGRQKPLP
jgi:hypothetical protein